MYAKVDIGCRALFHGPAYLTSHSFVHCKLEDDLDLEGRNLRYTAALMGLDRLRLSGITQILITGMGTGKEKKKPEVKILSDYC